ncbi:ATP-grasp domain-containing protein [Beggiatoa leptomitoformis]|uniref:ATP-grasp domain-containing protein n=1 Tax=Beggiatoa leptomitoformis TaxID=288004 RepID=A0A2N9YEQ9_9GAMM|nr:ATP-grasp domain-containing protein [Beggiatoa leptomitoformis]AUI68895.1 ATP-grasp domain-containing protein [Beggiatoa leptomitoformis]QGX03782.1 ATP-grasp domain-containing protein [Beggiatoa leptomitoformis]
MRLFIFEFISSGYLLDQTLPDSLVIEGDLMLRCLLNDAVEVKWKESIEICTLRDYRLAPLNLPIQVYTPRSTNEARAHWQTALQWANMVLVVAPETEGVLATFSQAVVAAKKILLGCRLPAIQLTTSKRQTALQLASYQLPIIPSYQARQAFPESPNGWIVKPDTGAGCEHTYLCNERAMIRQYLPLIPNPIIQPYIVGEAASLTLLTDGINCRLVAVNKQHIQVDNHHQLHLNTLTVNLFYSFASRFQAVVECLPKAIPGLWGWVGVDVLITDTDYFVVEVNPRLTTSYVGLKTSIQANPLSLLLHLLYSDEVFTMPLAHEAIFLGNLHDIK